MTRKIILRVLFFMLVAIIPSCGSDENDPVRVNFDVRFELNTQQPAHFSFSRLAVSIHSLRFVGTRQTGNDVVFNTRPGQAVGFFDLNPSRFLVPVTWFDIPEGVYNSMRWELATRAMDDDIYHDDDPFSLDDYGMVIFGSYTRVNGAFTNLIIALDPADVLKFDSFNAQNQLPVTLIFGNTYSAEVVINPFAIMGAVPRSMLEQAEFSEEDEGFYLVISSDENEDIYSLLLLSLSRNLRVIVK